MNWFILILAAAFEICWAIGLKYTEGWTRLLPSLQRDVAPMGDGAGGGFDFGKWKIAFWIGLIIVMVAISLMSSDDGRDCDSFKTTFGEASNEYQQCLAQARAGGSSRTRGGSFGGFSSGGGGHK